MQVEVILHELNLGGLTAVDQKIVILDLKELTGGKPAIGWHRSTGSEYGDVK
jgi:hypothetical protein